MISHNRWRMYSARTCSLFCKNDIADRKFSFNMRFMAISEEGKIIRLLGRPMGGSNKNSRCRGSLANRKKNTNRISAVLLQIGNMHFPPFSLQ